MALTKEKMSLLQELANRHMTVIDLESEHRIRMVQDLVSMGYARDFADHHGHRVQVRLRIWGITSAGKAVLEQQAMAEMTKGRQPPLTLFAKEPLMTIPKRNSSKPSKEKKALTLDDVDPPKEGQWDGRKWFQKTDGGFTNRTTRRANPRDGIERDDQ